MRIFNMGDQGCDENRVRLPESRMMRKYQVRFGGGQTEKGPQSHLACWLPTFSEASCGFRPGRGCHTALREVHRTWAATVWFIEGDISQCFDKLDHKVLLSILRESFHDEPFIRLISELLKAGYLEDWRFNATLSGTPQGGVVSPILSNIYLDRLDKYVERILIPAYTRGKTRRTNPTYDRMQSLESDWRRKGRREEARKLKRQMRAIPSIDTTDPNFRRLRYVRYADDFLMGLYVRYH